MRQISLVIIGGGPAGLAAAIKAREMGLLDLIVIERDERAGGILNQCIHNGFGLHTFKEELTGTEYAKKFVDKAKGLGIIIETGAMVVDISTDKVVTLSSKNGMDQIQAKAIILAMGCRERPRGAINIPGYRPAGIYTAGTAQYFVNIEGKLPGKKYVILGSGDIGLIMARRLTLEGCEVKCVVELMPYSGGLKRNIVQCLNDFDIPLLLSHTVTNIYGKDRVEGVTVAKVDEQGQVMEETEIFVECDTLLLSVGLIPENELSKKMGVHLNKVTNGPIVDDMLATNIPGVFACGNVLHVHDLVDYVSEEAALAGENAVNYLRVEENQKAKENENAEEIRIIGLNGIRYTVPSLSHCGKPVLIRFRVQNIYRDCLIVIRTKEEIIYQKKKKILTPGEMEQVLLTANQIRKAEGYHEIILEIKEE